MSWTSPQWALPRLRDSVRGVGDWSRALVDELQRRLSDLNARVTIRLNTGADIGTRRRLNLIEGSNVTLTIADDATNEEVAVTIDAAGGGGGGAPTSAQYVTLATHASLSAERVLAVTSGHLTLADGGANGNVTLGLEAAGPGATGPLGDANTIPIVTIDAQGRVTALSSVAAATGGTWDFGLVTETVSSSQDWGAL